MLDATLKVWNRLESIVIGLLSICALVVFLSGPVTRAFFPRSAPDWTEEVAIYFIVWASLLSGSLLIADKRHIAAETLVRRLPRRWQYAAAWVSYAIAFMFCCTMVYLGIRAVAFVNMLDERSASTLQVPQAFVLYLAMPVSMALIVLRLIVAGIRARGAPDLTGIIETTDTAVS